MSLLKRPMFWVFAAVVSAAIAGTMFGCKANSAATPAPAASVPTPTPQQSGGSFWVPVGGYDVECTESQSGRVICDWDNKRLRVEG